MAGTAPAFIGILVKTDNSSDIDSIIPNLPFSTVMRPHRFDTKFTGSTDLYQVYCALVSATIIHYYYYPWPPVIWSSFL